MWVDIANLRGPRGQDGRDGNPGPAGPVNIGLNPEEPIVWDQAGGFTFNLVDGSAQTVNLPIASAQSAGLLAAGGALPTTGRRDIRGLMEIGEGGIYVQRTGPIVELNLYGIAVPGAATSNLINLFGSNFPQGFRPVASFTAPLITTSAILEPFPIRVFMNNAGRCSVTDSGYTLFGLVHYLTRDGWPSSLPGTAA